jgi:glycolate oxidase
LIRATSSDQVATTVRICARFGVPITARGAGTGLSGGANAIDGGVIIALDRLNQIRLIDPLERLAVVQAGVINDELRAFAAEQRLWYPPDPASSPWSTIGGNAQA